MKKNSIWIILAVVYVLVIAGVVMFRMKKPTEKTRTTVTTPITSTSTTPTIAPKQLYVGFNLTKNTNTSGEVTLTVQDSSTFESAGYTLEIGYDQKVIKITDVAVGDIWDKSSVLQKDLTTNPEKIVFSVGRGFDSKPSGGVNLATIKYQVVDKQSETTQITLSQISRSAAGEGIAQTIVAEPLTVTLK